MGLMPEDDELIAWAEKVSKPQPVKKSDDKDQVASVLDQEFQSLGYPSTARLSILGDIGRENNWDRNTIFKGHADPKNKAYNRGIISWQGDRQQKLNNFLKQQGVLGRNDDEELRGMARFMDQELQTEYPDVHRKLRAPRSTAEASDALQRYIKYVPEAPYNTPDPEFRVKNNRTWAERARKIGLAQDIDHRAVFDEVDSILADDKNIWAEVDEILKTGQSAPTFPNQTPQTSILSPSGKPFVKPGDPLAPDVAEQPIDPAAIFAEVDEILAKPDITSLPQSTDNFTVTNKESKLATVTDSVDNPDGTTTLKMDDGTTSTVRYQKNKDGSLTPVEVGLTPLPGIAARKTSDWRDMQTHTDVRVLDDEPSIADIRKADDTTAPRTRTMLPVNDKSVAETFTIPSHIKTPDGAAKYVKDQLQAKYGQDFSRAYITQKGWKPGTAIEVSYGSLRNAGVDVEPVIAERRAQTEQAPDLSLRGPKTWTQESVPTDELRTKYRAEEMAKHDPRSLSFWANQLLKNPISRAYDAFNPPTRESIDAEVEQRLGELPGTDTKTVDKYNPENDAPWPIAKVAQLGGSAYKGFVVDNFAPLLETAGIAESAFRRYALGEDVEAKNSSLFKSGQVLRETHEKGLPKGQGGLDEQFTRGLGQAAGTILMMAATGGLGATAKGAPSILSQGTKAVTPLAELGAGAQGIADIATRSTLKTAAGKMLDPVMLQGAVIGVGQQASEAYQVARNKGATEDQALLASLLSAPGGLMEGLSEAVLLNRVRNIQKLDSIGAFSGPMMSRIKEIAKAGHSVGATELFEEAFQGINKEVATQIAKTDDFKTFLKNVDQAVKDSLMAYPIGFALGGAGTLAQQSGEPNAAGGPDDNAQISPQSPSVSSEEVLSVDEVSEVPKVEKEPIVEKSDVPASEQAQAVEPRREDAKEPWQMTRKDFARNFVIRGENDTGLKAGIEGKRLASPGDTIHEWRRSMAYRFARSGQNDRLLIFNARDAKPSGLIDDYSVDVQGAEPIATLVPRDDADPHRLLVEQALSEGKPVPPEVLADYPDLAASPTVEESPVPSTPTASDVETVQETEPTRKLEKPKVSPIRQRARKTWEGLLPKKSDVSEDGVEQSDVPATEAWKTLREKQDPEKASEWLLANAKDGDVIEFPDGSKYVVKTKQYKKADRYEVQMHHYDADGSPNPSALQVVTRDRGLIVSKADGSLFNAPSKDAETGEVTADRSIYVPGARGDVETVEPRSAPEVKDVETQVGGEHQQGTHWTPLGEKIRRRINTLAERSGVKPSDLEDVIQGDVLYARQYAQTQSQKFPDDAAGYRRIVRLIDKYWPVKKATDDKPPRSPDVPATEGTDGQDVEPRSVLPTPPVDTLSQRVGQAINSSVFQNHVPESLQKDGQRVLDAIHRNDIPALKKLVQKYARHFTGSFGGGGVGPGKVFRPDPAKVAIAKQADYAWRELAAEASATVEARPDAKPPLSPERGTVQETEPPSPDGYHKGRPAIIVKEGQGKIKIQYLDGKKETPIIRKKEFETGDVSLRSVPSRDYAGEHQAPGRDGGSPLHDLTDTYPEDIYSANGARYYGDGSPYDGQAVSIMRGVRGRPNAKVRVYRAVPYEPSTQEQIDRYERQKREILRRGKLPKDADRTDLNSSKYYEYASEQIERLQASPVKESSRFSINAGDWVTTVRQYAKDHGEAHLRGQYKIVSKAVPAKDLFTDGNSVFEYGYDPEGSEVLKKVRTQEDIDALESLSKSKDFRDIVPNVESSTDGNTVTLNAEAAEVVRTLLADVEGKSRDKAPIIQGLFVEPDNVTNLIEAAEEAVTVAEDAGLDSAPLKSLVTDLQKAAEKNGTVVLKVFDEAESHERIHEASYLGAIGKQFEARYANSEELKKDPVFQKFHKALNKLQGKSSHGVAMEEALGYLGDGDYAQFGLTKDEAVDILAKLVTKYAEANGVESLKNFDNTKLYEQIENFRRQTSDESRGDVGQGRETRPDNAEETPPQARDGEREKAFTPGGKEKLSQTPKSLRGKNSAFDSVPDRSYTSTSNAERTEFANSILDKGITHARNWLDEQIKDGNNNAGATQAVGLTLMNHYARNGGIDAMNDIADALVPMMTDVAQALQAMSIVSQFDPDTAAAYAAKMKKQRLGKGLTKEEAEKAVDLANTLDETAKTEAVGEAAEIDVKEYIEELKAENNAIREALDARPTKTDITNLKRQLARWKNKALGLTNTVGRVSRTHRDLLQRKDDILARLREKFPNTEVLRSVPPKEIDAVELVKDTDGNLLAPNGKKSKLPEHLWRMVRTPSFKRWFGDWEAAHNGKDDEYVWSHDDVSKVVDENGEPRVVYHGTKKGGFGIFRTERDSKVPDTYWFTSDRDSARSYSGGARDDVNIAQDEQAYDNEDFEDDEITPHKGVYSVFLNLRRPWETNFEGANWDGSRDERKYYVSSSEEYTEGEPFYSEDGYQFVTQEEAERLLAKAKKERPEEDWTILTDEYHYETTDSAAREGKQYGDGTIIHDVTDSGSDFDFFEPITVYVANEPNQIKSIFNEGSFDPTDAHILRSIPSKNFDDDTRQDLIDLTALKILDGTSYKDVIADLTEITKDTLNEDEIKAIHANAVESIAGESPTAKMTAEKLAQVRQKIKNRNEHKAQAKKFRAAPNPSLNRLELEILHIAPNDKERMAGAILARTPSIKEFYDILSHAYPDLTKKDIDDLYVKGTDLKREAQKNLKKQSLENRQQITLAEGDLERIKEERRVNMHRARKAQKEAENFYNGLVRTKGDVTAESIVNIRRANLLTGVKTHLRNMLGNIGFGASEEATRGLSYLADLGASFVTGERTVQGYSPTALFNSFKNIVKADETLKNIGRERGITIAKNILFHGDTLENMERQQHSESVLGEKFTGAVTGKVAKSLDAYINGVFRTLGAEDALFKVFAFRRSLEEQATTIAKSEQKRGENQNWKTRRDYLIKNPTLTMQMHADDFATFMTFQNTNALSDFFTKVKRVHPAVKTVAETLVPYDRTPTNIVLRVTEHLPLIGTGIAIKRGFDIRQEPSKEFRNKAREAVEGDNQWQNLDAQERRKLIDEGIAKEWTRAQQAKFARTFGRSTAGTTLFMLGFGLAAKGLLTGSMSPDDEDKTETNEFFERMARGIENKSLRIPGVGRFVLGDDPASKVIAAGATFYEQTQMTKGDPILKTWGGAKEATKDILFEQPLMGNIGQFYTSVKKGKFGELTGGIVGGYVPTIVSDIGEIEDEKPRTTSGYKKGEKIATARQYLNRQGRGFRNSVLRRIPIARHYADESNVAVKPEVRGGMLRRAVRAIDPLKTRPDQEYRVTQK